METAIHNTSEIGRLRRVLLHRPGGELENLMPGEIARRYSPQLASRIEGEYQLLPFFGKDIRKLKKERNV